MTNTQLLIAIALISLATLLTRAIPFLIFSSANKTPKVVSYLGKVLPGATIAMLVVYCFRDLQLNQIQQWAPALIATLVVVGLQYWRGKIYLSIVGGTAVYMILIQTVFK